jgi:trimethylamine:corrinoid methyltransferase-like protein
VRELIVEDSIQEEKERLREATAIETEELKEAASDFAAAARNQAHEAVETGRWASLYGAFAVGLLWGLRKRSYLSA